MSDFVHLHVHSHYSLLQALPKIKDLVNAAVKNKMPALALTDYNNMHGAISFYKKCQDEGIKPILGVDLTTFEQDEMNVHNLVLLAKTNEGYKNLIRLVTIAHTKEDNHPVAVSFEDLTRLSSDLICIIPSIESVLHHFDTDDQAYVEKLRAMFGKENVYAELSVHPELLHHDEQMEKLRAFATDIQLPLVAAQDVSYIETEDRLARRVLQAIGEGQVVSEDEVAGGMTEDFSFTTTKQALKLFSKDPEALANMQKIVDACTVDLTLGVWTFPDYEIPENTTYDDELRRVAYEGIARRGLPDTPELRARIEYELDIIKTKGYSSYFLIVSDLLQHARTHDIVSTTRGSAAGSMVSYLTYITTVNPMEYKLPFERFLNPERPSAPDIDMDIADDKRDEMIAYAKEKYGVDKVAQIGTFGTMMARGAVRDVARALGYSYNEGDRIAKLIPMGSQGFPMTIKHAIEIEPDLKKIYKEEQDVQEIVDMAQKIEGCARHISIHAAGVVISPTPLTDFSPLQLDPKGGKIITQYDMHGVEDAGLVKFDFLGIKNLAILADAIKRVKRIHGVEVDLDTVPLDDKKTFAMLAKGATIGLFQLSGAGMTRYLKDLRPTTIHDINAMVALYRPGPMESIPEYIKRKYNPELVTHIDPRMKDILSHSYGVITYQDDVMLIAINLAGYSWLEADKLRKAMGKKIPAEMEAQKIKLLEGFEKNGMSKQNAQHLWSLIEPFAAYGFNKSHAASYGRVAYQTAYLKANFPATYLSAVLTADSGDTERIAETIEECNRLGIPVLPPDINESFEPFSVVKRDENDPQSVDKIRFGLLTIKNFGAGIAHAIVEERKAHGHFKSLEDFLTRVTDRNLNRKSLESLIKAGAMDAFGERGNMLHNIEDLLDYNKTIAKTAENQNSLFSLMDSVPSSGLHLDEGHPASFLDKLSWEKELLGLYVSGHPITHYADRFKDKPTIVQLAEESIEGSTVVIGGLLESSKEIFTKSGDKMSFASLSDKSGKMEIVFFPKVFAEFKEYVKPGTCIVVKGKFSRRNDAPSILVERIKKID